MNTKNPSLGIFLIIVAMLAFSIMSGFAKACLREGFPTQEIMFFQNAVALAVILPWIFREGKSVLVPSNKALVIGRAMLGLTSMYLFFLAVRMVSLVNAVLLQNTVPLFIPFLSLVFFKKKISLQVWATIIIGFIGVVIVLNPGKGFLQPGDLIALSAGFISAVVTIVLGRLADQDESVPTIMLYYFLITMTVTGIWAAPTWKAPQGIMWIYLIFAGVLYGTFQILMVLSLKYATPIIVSPFIYLAVVFSGLVDWAAWKQSPNLITVIGTVIVITGAVLSTVHHKKIAEN